MECNALWQANTASHFGRVSRSEIQHTIRNGLPDLRGAPAWKTQGTVRSSSPSSAPQVTHTRVGAPLSWPPRCTGRGFGSRSGAGRDGAGAERSGGYCTGC